MEELFTILVSNIIFSRFIGMESLLDKKNNRIILSGLISGIIMFLSGLALHPLADKVPAYVKPLFCAAGAVILAFIILLLCRLIRKEVSPDVTAVVFYAAFNSVIFTAVMENLIDNSFRSYCIASLENTLGFIAACWAIKMVRAYFYAKHVPAPFRGYPALLLYLVMISMAVYSIR
jgi:electron transport complex protein RnfA